MFNPKRAVLFIFLIAVLLEPILGRKGFGGGHSYPKSGGLSGGGHRSGGLSGGHGYPSSGGSHGYPSSGGLSGGGSGSHGYPPSGGLSGSGSRNHGYPPSGGLSGGGSGGSHPYPSSGVKPGGSHAYPSGGGLSGNGHGYPQNKPAVHHTTNNYHYHYTPPQQISYSPVRGAAPVHYPVYHGTPPTYVYQYKDSGSKYGTLLAGLALLNLGTLGVAAYAASGHGGGGGSRTQYTPQPGEVCKFAVKKDNGDYEETKIDCQIISSFILQDQMQTHTQTGTNTTTSVVTVTNTTIMNTTNMHPETTPAPVGDVLYKMLPNGTLVPVNNTGLPGPVVPGGPVNVTQNVTAPNGVVTSSVVTTTTTNTTLVNALDVKGKPVEVTPGMQCFVIRSSPIHNMRKNVPCGLLQTYADKSIQRNSASRSGPMFTVVAAIVALCVAF
ncbi:hypothetical protein PYW07_003732 [Mythimna separata]|uniref:Uncharacterized protein n=1 Tax=Mythimna separata TaxID=271217 RepID=A0AAD7YQ64_MYTSE|nr:hypothetical protein PYW07_003732 [Mythimna separata]